MNTMFISKRSLLHNLNYIKSTTNKKICAVVKANGYGHGLEQIVSLLKGNVDYFAVANLDEALRVRKLDKNTPILVFFECYDYEIATKNNISVSVYDLEQLKFITQLNLSKPIKIHIKYNSGMNRLGFNNLAQIKKAFKIKNKQVIIEGIYTHFAIIIQDQKIYQKHKQKFDKIVKFAKSIEDSVLVHTGGSFDIENQQSDMIRTGKFLYGNGRPNLKPIMNIWSSIMQIHKLHKGEKSGYNKEFIAIEDCYIATLPIGYYDGIKKFFKNGIAIYNKQKCPIVAVCMDCIMVKVPKQARVNEKICIFYNADLYSNFTNTSEVLTGFSSFRGERKIID